MRYLFAFFALILLLSFCYAPLSQAAQRPVLDCNFSFDYIAQIQIFDKGAGQMSYRLLTNTGRWLDEQPLDTAQWAAKDIRFEARGRNFDGGLYRFYSPNGGRHWNYEVRIREGVSPSTVGGADCD